MHKIIIFLCITTCVFAEERVKITKILDNNHYLTAKGDTISPAYVHCIERNPQAPEWNWLVEETYDYLHDSFRTFKILIQKDSLLSNEQVHIYRKLPFGRESLNYNLLRNGYGKLVDAENAPALYIQAAQEAERKYIGIHKKKDPKFAIQYQNAVWLTVGSNGGVVFSDYGVGLIEPPLQSSLTFRHKKYVFNAGYDVFRRMPKNTSGIYKFGLGLASHRQGSEINMSVGPAFYTIDQNEGYWDAATNTYKRKKVVDYHVGYFIKTQLLGYPFGCIGFGVAPSIIIIPDFTLFSVSFELVLGKWFHPEK